MRRTPEALPGSTDLGKWGSERLGSFPEHTAWRGASLQASSFSRGSSRAPPSSEISWPPNLPLETRLSPGAVVTLPCHLPLCFTPELHATSSQPPQLRALRTPLIRSYPPFLEV